MIDDLFEALRPRLMGIAYRLLGTVSEAEDAVQDVFLKWFEHRSGTAIENPAAWLTAVCTNRCLDILKSAHRKRMSYVGPWLPEPLLTETASSSEETAALSSSLGTAFLLMLERLTPKERAAYLLREVFDYDYAEAAAILNISAENCRQLVSRARAHVGSDSRRTETPAPLQAALLASFQQAVKTGETKAFARMLGRSVELHADSGGKVLATERVLMGVEEIEGFVRDVLHRAWRDLTIGQTQINGEPGLILNGPQGVFGCVTCAVDEQGDASRIFIVRNPEKLRHLVRPARVARENGGMLI